MPFFKRLLITVIVMVATSFIAGQIWFKIFNTVLPSYVAGIVGGLSALPVWELFGRVTPKN